MRLHDYALDDDLMHITRMAISSAFCRQLYCASVFLAASLSQEDSAIRVHMLKPAMVATATPRACCLHAAASMPYFATRRLFQGTITPRHGARRCRQDVKVDCTRASATTMRHYDTRIQPMY